MQLLKQNNHSLLEETDYIDILLFLIAAEAFTIFYLDVVDYRRKNKSGIKYLEMTAK